MFFKAMKLLAMVHRKTWNGPFKLHAAATSSDTRLHPAVAMASFAATQAVPLAPSALGRRARVTGKPKFTRAVRTMAAPKTGACAILLFRCCEAEASNRRVTRSCVAARGHRGAVRTPPRPAILFFRPIHTNPWWKARHREVRARRTAPDSPRLDRVFHRVSPGTPGFPRALDFFTTRRSPTDPPPSRLPPPDPGEPVVDGYTTMFPSPPVDRRAGVIMHPTSLPGMYGIGDLGQEAYAFVVSIYRLSQIQRLVSHTRQD